MSFKVIDGGGPGKEERDLERQREWAKDEVSSNIRECAANILRIIRGAGKPHQLLIEMQRVIESSVKFQSLHGYWPKDVFANALGLENEMDEVMERGRSGLLAQEHIDRWSEDGHFEQMTAEYTVHCGLLQIIASRLLGQTTQESAGDSEFSEGFRALREIRAKRRKKHLEEMRASTASVRPKPRKRKLTPRKPAGGTEKKS